MGLSMVYLEELPLVLGQARGHFLLARRVAAQVEPPDPVRVLVPAGRDRLPSLWLESQDAVKVARGLSFCLSPTSCGAALILFLT